MIARISIFLMLAAGLVLGDEPVLRAGPEPPVPAAEGPTVPWVGLRVAHLDQPTRAHAPGVPEGVGFLVASVDEGGPAGAAGVRAYDILWKLDDQLLVNEAQFATLLRLREPGDTVRLGIVRSGEQLGIEVELGAIEADRPASEISPAEVPLMPAGVPGMPRTIVYPRSRTAEVSRQDGSMAKLRYQDGEPVVVIRDASDELIYEGPVREDDELRVPEEWRCPVDALLRTMHRAERPDWKPREPRPRVVTPPDGDGD